MQNTNQFISLSEAALQKLLKFYALRYLSRYSTSKHKLHTFLQKKIQKYYTDIDFEVLNSAIEKIVNEMENLGYINDQLYAKYKSSSSLSKGKSLFTIEYELQEKGIDKQLVKANFNSEYSEDDINLYSALKLIKRKKFGYFNVNPLDDGLNDKEITSMMRKGFNYDTIKQALRMPKDAAENYMLAMKDNLYL